MDNKQTAQKIADTAKQAEATVNEVVGKVTSKLDEVIPENAKKTAQNVWYKAQEIAGKVDEMADKVDDFADSILPEQTGTDVDFQPQWSATISRLFILRFLWLIVQYPILIVRGFGIWLIAIVHIVYMLITWSRQRWLRDALVRFHRHNLKWGMYIIWVTDKRPEIIER